jgi:hypothetical protein
MREKNSFLYSYSTILYIIFPVSIVLQGRQNMNKSMYLGPFQKKILFQNSLYLFCPPLKYFSLPILISEKIKFYFNFLPTL